MKVIPAFQMMNVIEVKDLSVDSIMIIMKAEIICMQNVFKKIYVELTTWIRNLENKLRLDAGLISTRIVVHKENIVALDYHASGHLHAQIVITMMVALNFAFHTVTILAMSPLTQDNTKEKPSETKEIIHFVIDLVKFQIIFRDQKIIQLLILIMLGKILMLGQHLCLLENLKI